MIIHSLPVLSTTVSTDLFSAGVVLILIALLAIYAAGGAISVALRVLRMVFGPLLISMAYFAGAVILLVVLSPLIFNR